MAAMTTKHFDALVDDLMRPEINVRNAPRAEAEEIVRKSFQGQLAMVADAADPLVQIFRDSADRASRLVLGLIDKRR
jgi:hypothetical protein